MALHPVSGGDSPKPLLPNNLQYDIQIPSTNLPLAVWRGGWTGGRGLELLWL